MFVLWIWDTGLHSNTWEALQSELEHAHVVLGSFSALVWQCWGLSELELWLSLNV